MKFEDFKLDYVYRDKQFNEWKVVCKSDAWVVLVNQDRTDYYTHYNPFNNCDILAEEVGDDFTNEYRGGN